MYKTINTCRICGNSKLKTVMNLGDMKLTGVFPLPGEDVDSSPLDLVKCDGENCCGLVQLRHSCDSRQMYGMNYGYRSGLNKSMVDHLRTITTQIMKTVHMNKNDIVVDIGSNDGTLLGTYDFNPADNIRRIGIDPTAEKFKQYYNPGIAIVEDFFSANAFKAVYGEEKAKIITSIAMFYDLEEPISFAKQIEECLAWDGIWVFEQSYLPYMIQAKSFDTVCQEHLEYYGMRQIEWIINAAELKIIDVDFNNINGGSFRITASKKESPYMASPKVNQAKIAEDVGGYNTFEVFETFADAVDDCKRNCIDFLQKMQKEGKRVIGYGASTKGNVLLQYFGIDSNLLPYIAEVNSDKYGHVTPGSNIPIISEDEARNMNPDFFFVLPWHFKNNIMEKENDYLKFSGCKMVFPLPKFSIEEGK